MLLDGRDGRESWQIAEASSIIYDARQDVLRLGASRAGAIPATESGGTFGGLTRPTGLAVGPDGRLILADPANNAILSYTTHQAAFTPLPLSAPIPAITSPPHPPIRQPRGVAFNRDGNLIVADTDHGRLLIYTWPMLALRHIITLPGPGAQPWDVAVDSRGRLYVADPAGGRVLRYDRLWRLDDAYRQAPGALLQPRHLAIDADDVVYVVDDGLRRVVRLRPDGALDADIVFDDLEPAFPPPLALREGALWLPQDDRPDCPALKLVGLSVDRGGRHHGLTLLARPRGVTYPRQGRYVSQALDSAIFQCQWHRLVLDVDLPATTGLAISTFTAPNRLDPERVAALPESRWSAPLILESDDTPEVLIQSSPGRFLWLRLDFTSGGEATPLIHSLTLYAPRQSSLQFLPPVFQEDPVSADFLDRFLSGFDTVLAEIESQIERFTGYLDPHGVPAGDFLTWLGAWFDWTFWADWSETTRRALIREAISLFKQRGTIPGLQRLIRLHTGLADPYPVVVEHFRLRDVPPFHLAGAPLAPGPDELAHHFTILVPDRAATDDEARTALHHLIEAQKPAHTDYRLRIVRPGLRIACQSTIGVDTLIGAPATGPLGEVGLGQGALLAPVDPYPRLGRARLLFQHP